MKKIREVVDGTRGFFAEVRLEMQKCSWPTRAELIASTVVVIVSVFIFAAFVGLSDTILMGFLGLIVN